MKGIYKAKTIDSNVWVEGFYTARYSHRIANKNGLYMIDESTICQSTNHTDKNGVQVFDGDICYDDLGECNVVISYDDNLLQWILIDGGCKYPLETYWFQYFSVIGNVHDNLELLKQKEGII